MDKDQWLISWTKYDKNRKDPRAGRKCFKTTTFKDLIPSDNNELCRAQLFVTESRVVNNMLEEFWKNWVGVTFTDIDSRHYWKDNNGEGDIIPERYSKDNPALVFGLVYKWIEDNYKDNIVDAETSRSKLGFHFYFKWDCEKNEYNHAYFVQVGNAIVKKAFIECGYEHIINYPKVFDDCTNSPVQFVYPTKLGLYHNYSCTGKIGLYNDLDINLDHIKKKEKSKIKDDIEKATGISLTNNGKYEFVLKEKRNVDKVDYIEHKVRWRLFDSLSRIYSDPFELKQEWCECAKKIPYKHTLQFYMDEPYKNNEGYTWANNLNGNEYCDIELLKQFGYDVEVIKISNNINDLFSEIINDEPLYNSSKVFDINKFINTL